MNKFRALLMGFAATVGAGGIAAYNGVFDRTEVPAKPAVSLPAAAAPKAETPAVETPAVEAPKTEAPAVEAPKAEPAPAQELAKTDPAPVEPAAPAEAAQPAPAVPALAAPTFDILRVEPDGSVLIAGKAGENAQVEVLSGANVHGVAKAGAP